MTEPVGAAPGYHAFTEMTDSEAPIRFIRLEDDMCDAVNRIAREQSERPSDIVNRILREQLTPVAAPPGCDKH
jgi:hypothetical protein